jgi:O-antigen/teichoic acid export membrane protein
MRFGALSAERRHAVGKAKQMGHGARLVSNSSWNGLAFLVGIGLNLLILPFVILHLGISEFGFAGLIAACVAPAMIFSTSLAQMTARELAQQLLPDLRDGARDVFATALFLSLAVGLSIVLLLLLAGPWLARRLFNLDAYHADHLLEGFAFGAMGWLCLCLAGVFLALFTARQDYARLAKINIGATVVATLLQLLLIPFWPRASTFLACQAAGFATSLAAAFWLTRRSLAEWLSMPALHIGPLRSLARVGSWQLAAQGGGVVAGQADRYLIGAFLQTRHVGFYNVAQRLEEAIYIGVFKIGEVLFPLFSSMLKETQERQADVLFRTSWLLNLLAVSVLGGLIPVAGEILRLWTNSEVAAEGEQVLVVLALAGILGSGSNVFAFYLLGSGKTRANALISLVTAIVILSTSALVLPVYGWRAAGWSSCAGMTAQLIVMVLLMRRNFNLKDATARIAHFVLMPLAVGALAALALREGLTESVDAYAAAWWQVGAWYFLSVCFVGGAVVAASSLGPHGRICRGDLRRILDHFLSMRRG